MNEAVFGENGISVHYFDYSSYPEYNQPYPPFQHGVSILDLLFSEGNDSRKFLKHLSK